MRIITESGINQKFLARIVNMFRFHGMRREYLNRNSNNLNFEKKFIRLENIRDLFVLIFYTFGFSTLILFCEIIVRKIKFKT
jgi:hypothetical protein